MPIKGWRKLSEWRYQSIIKPQQTILITRKKLNILPYDGWGVLLWTGYRNEVVVPSYIPKGHPGDAWIELSKKEATQAAMKWMRKHPRGF